MPAPSHARRNPRIEVLRLVAVVAVTVFHVFQTWFSAATAGTWSCGTLTLALLGVTSLLGTFGNHVFYMVSGMFLVPGAAARSHDVGFWPGEGRRLVRRALPIVATVALYAPVALAVSTWVVPIEGVAVGEVEWLVGGLEFIWVYLVLVALSPLVGWAWARWRHHGALVGALVVVVWAVNAYIAFVSPGEELRSLLEWRKLMSAVSYLVAFLVGGELGARRPARRSRARAALVGVAAVCVAAETTAACAGDLSLMAALSYKSTSLLSFALAVAAVALAASEPEGVGATSAEEGAAAAAAAPAAATPAGAAATSPSAAATAAAAGPMENLPAAATPSAAAPTTTAATAPMAAVGTPTSATSAASAGASAADPTGALSETPAATPVSPAGASPHGGLAAHAERVTPAILGFYVAQSMFLNLWRPAVESACATALAAAGEAAFVACGLALACALVAALLFVDLHLRVPLLRHLGLIASQ